jgi:hypothetical protein
MFIGRRQREQEQREALAEQHRREDAAPRLRAVVPNLSSLRLRFEDVRAEGRPLAPSYTRPIVVDSAPASFEVRCIDPRCDGRHDITTAILNGLKRSSEQIVGESGCPGMVGDAPCDRILSYVCEASFMR